MDTVSVVLIALLGLLVIWGGFKALSNVRHDPPTKVKRGRYGGFRL